MPNNNQIKKIKYPLYISGDFMEDRNLGFYEVGLLAMIEVFDKDEKHCYATNAFFADRLRVSRRTITRLIATLEAKGYIKILNKQNFKRKDYTRRIMIVRNDYDLFYPICGNADYQNDFGGVEACR